jgi:hypothetical protein
MSQHQTTEQTKIPVRPEDIEEFELIRLIPREAITDTIRKGVRKLDERVELEPFLRDILPDKTETPHTSSEIADILTTHVTYSGRPHLAAFINKGKSYPKVTARVVTHQIVRLKQIPHLSLLVLLAVGDIYDDAKRDFLTWAEYINADYMIVDDIDVARLLIAYSKVCPQDGTPYVEGKCLECGSPASKPTNLTLKVHEKLKYTILSHEDISLGIVKRYKASILTDSHYSKAILREVIKKVTSELRCSTFYRSALVEERFGEQEADSVFLFVYLDKQDVQTCNWVCLTSWTRPDGPDQLSSLPGTSEQLEGIQIEWRTDYYQMQQFWSNHFVKKEVWARNVEKLLSPIEGMVREAVGLLDEYRAGKIDQDELQLTLERLEPEAMELYQEAGAQDFPPPECSECDAAFQSMIGHFINVFLPFAKEGKGNWDWEQKQWLLQNALQGYEDEEREFLYEWKKVGKR